MTKTDGVYFSTRDDKTLEAYFASPHLTKHRKHKTDPIELDNVYSTIVFPCGLCTVNSPPFDFCLCVIIM